MGSGLWHVGLAATLLTGCASLAGLSSGVDGGEDAAATTDSANETPSDVASDGARDADDSGQSVPSDGGRMRAFVTLADFDGQGIGGLAAADFACAAEGPGTYRAWLSTSTQNAVDRLRDGGGPWYDPLGQSLIFVDDKEIRGAFPPHAPFTYSSGAPFPAVTGAWTGSSGTGTYNGGSCADWTSNLVSNHGSLGDPSRTDLWSFWGSGGCNRRAHLLCFEQ